MIIRQAAFQKEGNFLKGNLHCHTTLSDGTGSPASTIRHYANAGYDFLAITDHEHFNNNSYLDDENFITLTSAEFAIKQFPEQAKFYLQEKV